MGLSDCVRATADFVWPEPSLLAFSTALIAALRRAPLIGGDALGAMPCVKHDNGLWLEFGVYRGNTISRIARFRNRTRGPLPHPTYGFDSFLGLPETWRATASGTTRAAGLRKGAFSLHGQPPFAADAATLEWVIGWFNMTLPPFLAQRRRDEHVAFLHVDSDLYSSAATVLSLLSSRLRPGTVIVFDELFNFPGYEEGEIRALWELLRAATPRLAVEVLGSSTNQIGSHPERDVHPQSAAVRLVRRSVATHRQAADRTLSRA